MDMHIRDSIRFLKEVGATVGRGVPNHEVCRAEEQLDVVFPATYRQFLMECGWCSYPSYEVNGLGADCPALCDVVKQTSIERHEANPSLPHSLIPICADGDGNHYCLDLLSLEDDDCEVVYWNHDVDDHENPGWTGDTFAMWLLGFAANRSPNEDEFDRKAAIPPDEVVDRVLRELANSDILVGRWWLARDGSVGYAGIGEYVGLKPGAFYDARRPNVLVPMGWREWQIADQIIEEIDPGRTFCDDFWVWRAKDVHGPFADPMEAANRAREMKVAHMQLWTELRGSFSAKDFRLLPSRIPQIKVHASIGDREGFLHKVYDRILGWWKR
jgi:hypothetical protein